MTIDLTKLVTETRNTASAQIDTLTTMGILEVINKEDQGVAVAVAATLPEVARTVDAVVAAFARGGRLIYIGAGTSGRLGILDASECPPTYGTPASQVVGLIAGGHRAILQAVENAEDSPQQGAQDLIDINFSQNDVLVGIAASGRTPYVLGAIGHAKEKGAIVAAISCNPESPMTALADYAITPVVGPEVVTGSSRMKAGTAQKLILNMITTAAMIRSGKVYGNLMVDVEATNAKLVERQKRIVMEATECTREAAEAALSACGGRCKIAIVMILTRSNATAAQALLDESHGFIRLAIQNAQGGGV